MDASWTIFTTRLHASQQNLSNSRRSVLKSQSFSYGSLYLSLRDICNVQMTEQEHTTAKGVLLNNGINLNASTNAYKDKDKDKEKEKDDEGKKRRFSSFINHGYNNNSNKRPNAAPIRVLLLGRPLSGKSSIISMLLNRDVHPGLNGRGIFVNNKPFVTTPSLATGPSLEDSDTSTTSSPTTSTTSSPSTSSTSLTSQASNGSITLSPQRRQASATRLVQSPKLPTQDNISSPEPIDIDPPDKMAISPTITPDTPPASPRNTSSTTTSSPSSTSSTSPTSLPSDPSTPPPDQRQPSNSFFNTGRRIYQSDKYIITDIDGFRESNTSDIVGAVLEHRKWLEESMQGYNIVLMVIKAQEITETDRKIFALCNALLHDMKDMIHVAVTGCDMNPHWIKDHEHELTKVYGGVKAVGVSFPSTEGGLLECIFEQMRKDSLTVLEEYISKNATSNPRVPVKVPIRGGSVGSAEKKKMERTRNRTFSR